MTNGCISDGCPTCDINECIREAIKDNPDETKEYVTVAIIERLSELTEVCYINTCCYIHPYLTNLETLTIKNSNIEDIPYLKNLETLTIENCNNIKYISDGMTNIRTLTINNSNRQLKIPKKLISLLDNLYINDKIILTSNIG